MTTGTWEIKILQIASSGSLILGAMIPSILYAKKKTRFSGPTLHSLGPLTMIILFLFSRSGPKHNYENP